MNAQGGNPTLLMTYVLFMSLRLHEAKIEAARFVFNQYPHTEV